jgi:hypothetical protein
MLGYVKRGYDRLITKVRWQNTAIVDIYFHFCVFNFLSQIFLNYMLDDSSLHTFSDSCQWMANKNSWNNFFLGIQNEFEKIMKRCKRSKKAWELSWSNRFFEKKRGKKIFPENIQYKILIKVFFVDVQRNVLTKMSIMTKTFFWHLTNLQLIVFSKVLDALVLDDYLKSCLKCLLLVFKKQYNYNIVINNHCKSKFY